jgi:two-component sensor histidine kinase
MSPIKLPLSLQPPVHADSASDDPTRDHAGIDSLAALLRREADHRISNSLQLAGSLLALEAAHSRDAGARDSLARAGRSLRLIASTHHRLSDSGAPKGSVALDVHLLTLCDELYTALVEPEGHALLVNADPVRVPQLLADALAMIASELICNALKHAFPGRRGGLIELACGYAEDGRNLVLTLRDDGVGLPPGFDPMHRRQQPAQNGSAAKTTRRSGLGLQLLQGLILQYDGSLMLLHDRPGAGYRITLSCVAPMPGMHHPAMAGHGGTA